MGYATVLTHLSSFIEANVIPDGTAPRSVDAPLNWPNTPNLSDKVVFINQVTSRRLRQNNSGFTLYDYTVLCRLYYSLVGEGLDITSQYDVYHFADDFTDAIDNNNRLTVSGVDMPGIDRAVTIIGDTVPTTLTYPSDKPDARAYWGATFTLNIPIRVLKNC